MIRANFQSGQIIRNNKIVLATLALVLVYIYWYYKIMLEFFIIIFISFSYSFRLFVILCFKKTYVGQFARFSVMNAYAFRNGKVVIDRNAMQQVCNITYIWHIKYVRYIRYARCVCLQSIRVATISGTARLR